MRFLRTASIMILALVTSANAFAVSDPIDIAMKTRVGSGSGTLDNIGDIDGISKNGIVVYIGYAEGGYDSSLTIAQCLPVNNADAPMRLSLLDSDKENDDADSVTIYVAADSNVSSQQSVELRFSSTGWVRESSGSSDPQVVVDVVSNPAVVDVPGGESNVKAQVEGDNLILIADAGSPKGEDSRIVGYSELSWDRDADIPAGVYKATVTIEVVAGN